MEEEQRSLLFVCFLLVLCVVSVFCGGGATEFVVQLIFCCCCWNQNKGKNKPCHIGGMSIHLHKESPTWHHIHLHLQINVVAVVEEEEDNNHNSNKGATIHFNNQQINNPKDSRINRLIQVDGNNNRNSNIRNHTITTVE